jgi:hypothetical protein
MSTSHSPYAPTNLPTSADRDLLLRLRIALSVKRRAGWHLVTINVQDGIAQLAGTVPSFYDRQLIAALVRHVAGVLGIEDKIAVGDPAIRQQLPAADDAAHYTAPPTYAAPHNPFQHLPVLPQTLDDVLAGHALNAAPAY